MLRAKFVALYQGDIVRERARRLLNTKALMSEHVESEAVRSS
jgi:hypothetical protein